MAFLYLFLLIIAVLIFSPLLVAFLFAYFTKMGFEIMEFSSGTALAVLFLVFITSFINIPLGGKRKILVIEKRMMGLLQQQVWRHQGISVNVGGCLIPLFIVGYLFPQIPVEPFLITTTIVLFFSFIGARFVRNKGVVISMILPALFSAFFAILLAPDVAAQVAFSAGVIGVLVGADLLYLPFIMRKSGGVMTIGGAGIFDGIFLVGITAAILTTI
jgi:uncharacterized membrane protein